MIGDQLHGLHLIGFAGNIGSGKTSAAAMVPGAYSLQWADAMYRGLSALLGVGEVRPDRRPEGQTAQGQTRWGVADPRGG